MTGSSTQGIKTVLHPVSDLAKAKAVYAALLGVPPQADESYYVGYDVAGQHIGLVPGGQGMTSPVAYWHVPDIEAKLAEVTAAGATVNGDVHCNQARRGSVTGASPKLIPFGRPSTRRQRRLPDLARRRANRGAARQPSRQPGRQDQLPDESWRICR